MPIQWTGYEKSLSRYQGELIGKKSVQDRFLELLRAGRAGTSDIALVFRHLFQAFQTAPSPEIGGSADGLNPACL